MVVLSGKQSRNSRRSYRRVFAIPEYGVHETRHEGGVESNLGRQARHIRIRDCLGDDGKPNGDAGQEVGEGVVGTVLREPVEDGDTFVDQFFGTAPTGAFLEPFFHGGLDYEAGVSVAEVFLFGEVEDCATICWKVRCVLEIFWIYWHRLICLF